VRTLSVLIIAMLLALALGSPGCASEGEGEQVKTSHGAGSGEVRSPVVAGTFYPGDAAALAAEVDRDLDAARVEPVGGEIVGLVAPHAGYVYSGGVAAYAYALVRGGHYDDVIVIAPSHRVAFRGASVYGGTGYATPLGTVSVDRALADAISSTSPAFAYEPRAHAAEHSLEVQVPFLQRTLGDFSIVPIVMGDQSEAAVRSLAGAVASAVRGAPGKKVLLVASSDLSHYHSYEAANRLDSVVIKAVDDFDPEELLTALGRGECEACGGGPIAVVMMAARDLGADRARVVKHANSGDVTGDRSQVVGYMAAVITRPGPGGSDAAQDPPQTEERVARPYEGLKPSEQQALLKLARSSIETAFTGGSPAAPSPLTPALTIECGAFVTLREHGRLRGCIGYIQAVRPLYETVQEMARQAAFHDPRFPAVTAEEVPRLEIEISVLSPLSEVKDVSSIEVGRDGLIMSGRGRSGLLLPQVPTEYGWDRETFLRQTCLKAGLPPDAWKDGDITIRKFTADVFSEHDSEEGT
jgi:AmmeMemoRadiSam system protein B/AmmeMemoRadiSam system protein A